MKVLNVWADLETEVNEAFKQRVDEELGLGKKYVTSYLQPVFKIGEVVRIAVFQNGDWAEIDRRMKIKTIHDTYLRKMDETLVGWNHIVTFEEERVIEIPRDNGENN